MKNLAFVTNEAQLRGILDRYVREDGEIYGVTASTIAAEVAETLLAPHPEGLTGDQGYVALMWDYPLGGVASHRIYGPWPQRDDAHDEAAAVCEARPDDLHAAVLPLRRPATLKGERS